MSDKKDGVLIKCQNRPYDVEPSRTDDNLVKAYRQSVDILGSEA